MRYTIYTDGAAFPNPGSGGWAFILIDPFTGDTTSCNGAYKHTTNNRMEIMAVLKSLEYLPSGSSAVIYSDSAYVVNSLNEWIHKWRKKNWMIKPNKPVKNADLFKLYVHLCSKYNLHIELKWIKGHNGNFHNEQCDRLANEAIVHAFPVIDTEYLKSLNDNHNINLFNYETEK